MSYLEDIKKMVHDRRILDLNLKMGNITKEQYDKFIEQLPDLSNQCRPIDLEAGGDEEEFETH